MQPYSVIIPAFNAERTLAATLASVLAQTCAPAEVLVVDDGSTDGTAELAARFSPLIRVLRQPNTGPGAATSLGVRQATSPVVALVDADDLWLPDKMRRQLQVLESDAQVAAVSCSMRQFHHAVPDDGTGEVRKGLTRSTIVVRRSVFLSVGDVLDPPGNRGDMIDWFARLRSAEHLVVQLDEVLALRRILPGSLSHGRAPGRDIGYLKVAHLALLRQRQARASADNP